MSEVLNPYESPTEVDEKSPEQQAAIRRRNNLRVWLAPPAVVFITLGLLQATGAFVLAVASSPVLFREQRLAWLPIISFVDGIFMISVAVAGYRMFQLRSAGYVQTIAFLCCFPCVTPFFVIGLPFGLWATLVMLTPSNHDIFSESEALLAPMNREQPLTIED